MLYNPRKHPEWLEPHSLQWYQQLGDSQKAYLYPWKSSVDGPDGETVFDNEVLKLTKGKKVLDVGCGHGEFAIMCSRFAEEVTGFDAIDSFLESGLEKEKHNLKFVLGNTKEGLPFADNEFDIAYIRKGPTSAYKDLKRIVKNEGGIRGLHPGDFSGKELADLFPGFFNPLKGTPILDKIKGVLQECSFTKTEIEIIETIEYLHEPMDVIRYGCFGQSLNLISAVEKEGLINIKRIFEKEAGRKGLSITHSRYMIRVEL
ncbi:class I SAM-dependent methyltransferase [Planomicrobium okeanokoites]|uniref:Class I SAM-dependent methyltransferase n=1 Tax=Planomicrobium okeanokoites TaxID=244 RepID=A0ABV7KLN9_PLAOK|nr:class I SAM-dependent methyltransferase [Planomicrobium okeanokoites]TAA67750.1 class I SAM-dependent methyltransferase [Planomicrobium okeanokoites]